MPRLGSRWGYWLAGVLLLAGAVFAVLMVLGDQPEALTEETEEVSLVPPRTEW